jgi:hypothetical protein
MVEASSVQSLQGHFDKLTDDSRRDVFKLTFIIGEEKQLIKQSYSNANLASIPLLL